MKVFLYTAVLCFCLLICVGCGDNSPDSDAPSKGDLQFSRYYNQNISKFLEDYGLDADDMVITDRKSVV